MEKKKEIIINGNATSKSIAILAFEERFAGSANTKSRHAHLPC